MHNQSTQWQFLDTGFHSGAFNMDFDEQMALEVQRGVRPPSVRVYGWKPSAISLGHHQNISDIDEELCRSYGFDIVRRPTGGRAILHADELTYSVAMPADGKNILNVYRKVSLALVRGLRSIGANVTFSVSQPDFAVLYRKQSSIPCFSSSAKYEIQFNGKKLVGSAQRRYLSSEYRETVLQHGSVLIGRRHTMLSQLLNVDSPITRERIREEMETKTTDLMEILGRSVNYSELASAVKNGFEKEWNISFAETMKETMTMEDVR